MRHEDKFSSALISKKTNVHLDDIHGIQIYKDQIISGSKDTTVRLFSREGEFQRFVSKHPSFKEDSFSYYHWVTALDIFPDGSAVIGHRNSFLRCIDARFGVSYFGAKLSYDLEAIESDSLFCRYYKTRNKERIMSIKCLRGFADSEYTALIGFPEVFLQVNFDTKSIVRKYVFRDPEWVYGFAQLDAEIVAVIHGCSLSVFRMTKNGWERVDSLVEMSREKPQPEQRPFISSVSPMSVHEYKARLVLSFFGGATKILDCETKTSIFEAAEHTQRVWQAVPFSEHEYASCADDGLIKIWDVRQKPCSIRTLGGHPGRVSAMAFFDKSSLVAGSCSEKPREDPDKAQFFFYDLRRI